MELHSEGTITPRLSIMKFSLFLGCLVVSILVVASSHTFDSILDEDWKNWKSQYEKQYMEGEEAYRRMIWEDSLRYIEQHNLEHSMGKHTFTVGMNQFGDLTTEEFTKFMNGFLQAKPHNSTKEVNKDDEDEESDDVGMAATVDWRSKGYVTPVKNQGRCGSCWAFSATGSLEGQWFKKKGKLVPLSEQNLIDCSRQHGTAGCDGGWMTSAFDYVKDNGGINSAATYPYTGKDGVCTFQKSEVAATITGYKLIQPKTEQALAEAVKSAGPISVAIDASPQTFQYYSSGVYYEPKCSRNVNHGVLVVGYGNEGGLNYWIVKNSWGADWGDKGYIKMAKDKDDHCGISSDAVYPLV